MKRLVSLAVGMTILSLSSAFGQWEGSFKVDGAWNFEKSNNENADVRFKYSGRKFYIGANAYAAHSFLPSIQTTSILDAKKEKNEYYKGEDKTTDPKKLKAGVGMDFGFIFNPYNKLDFSIGYGYTGTGQKSTLQTKRYNNSDQSTLNGTQIDTSYVINHDISSKVAYKRDFIAKKDAHLEITLSNTIKTNDDANRRITSGNFYSKFKNYAIYSELNDFDTKLSAAYDDIFHFKKSDMKFKAGLDYTSNQDVDVYCAETFVNGHWRDSTEYRQSYYYNAQSVEPFVNITFTLGKFDFFVRERLQFYWHTMLDKLEERQSREDFKGLFDKLDIRNLLNAGITYRINDRHSFILDYGRSISRPDYKKLCPTLTIGKSEGEYFIGTPDLLPETTDKINLGYTYTQGIFITRLDFNYRDRKNTADKVIDLKNSKEITDPGVKTIYTWINCKKQESLGTKLNLKMNGRDVQAEIWAAFNYDIFWKNDKEDKEDFNYELGTSINVALNETTKLSSSIAYISAKQSAYNLKGEDIIANLRISKTIIKGLDAYLEFKDIADKDIYEVTWNADWNYLKETMTKPMHRAALIGINYRF